MALHSGVLRVLALIIILVMAGAPVHAAVNHFTITAAGGGAIPTQTAGTSFAISITAYSSADDSVVDATYTGAGTELTLTSTATLSAGSATGTFTAGVLASHNVTVTLAATLRNITVVGGPATSTNTFTVNAGAVADIAFSTQPAAAVAGAAFGTQPVVRTVDAFGNPSTSGLAASLNVVMTIASGTGPLQGTATLNIGTGGGNGTATFTTLRIDPIGAKTLLATAGAFTDTSGSFTVAAGAVADISISTQPGSAVAGAAFGAQPMVITVDSVGNPSTSGLAASLNVVMTIASGSGTLQGTTTLDIGTSGGNGTVSFTDLRIDPAGAKTLLATAGAFTDTSSSFTVVADTVADISFSTQPAGATAGAAFGTQPVIRTVDAYGNPSTSGLAASLNVVMTIASGSGSLQGTATLDIGTGVGNGTATFTNLRIDPIGAKTLLATAGAFTDTSGSFTVAAGTVADIAFSTQPGGAVAGADFTTQPVVITIDAQGNPSTSGLAANLNVVMTVASGSGSLQGTATLDIGTSGGNGTATFTDLRIDPAGAKTLLATAGGFTDTSSSFTVAAGTVADISISTQPGSAVAGAAFGTQPVVRTVDAYGNPSTSGLAANLNVVMTIASGSGTLQGTTTLDIGTGVGNGTATFTNLRIDPIGAKTLLATAGAFTDTSGSFTVAAGTVADIAFSTQPGGAVAGADFTTQPVVITVDAQGNPSTSGLAANLNVVMTVASGTGTLQGTTTLNIGTSGGNGTATFTNLRLNPAGAKTLLATAGSFTDTSASFTVGSGAVADIVFSAQPTGAVAGAAFTTQPVVRTVDAQGNPSTSGLAASLNVVVTIASGGGTLQGTATLDIGTGAGNGTATFTNLRIDQAGAKTLLATAGGFTDTSASFTVAADTVADIAFSTQPAGAVSGAAFGTQPVVRTVDAYGNPSTSGLAANLNVVMTIASGTGTLQGTTTLNIGTSGGNGTATFTNLRIDPIGAKTLLATAGAFTDTSGSFTVTAGTVADISFSTQPGGAVAGADFTTQPVIITVDAQGNPSTSGLAANLNVVMTVASGTGTLQGTTTLNIGTSGGNGTATFTNLRLNPAGAKTLLATAGAFTDTSASFTVGSGTVADIVFSTQPAGAVAGAAFTTQPVVRTVDAQGNPSTSGLAASLNVVVSIASGTGTLQGTATLDIGTGAGNGTVTFTNLRIDQAGAKTLLATAGAFTDTSASFTVVATTATTLAFTTQPAGATAGANFTTQPVVRSRDAYGNDSIVGLGATVNVTMTLQSGSGTLAGTVVKNIGTVAPDPPASTTGVAGYASLRIDDASDAKVLRASATLNSVLVSVDSASFTVSHAVVNRLRVTGPATATAGVPVVITVRAEDQFGNLATSFDQNVFVNFSGANNGTGGAKTTVTDINGIARDMVGGGENTELDFTGGLANQAVDPQQCSMRLVRVETAAITASSTTPNLVTSTPLSVVVSSGVATQLVVTAVSTTTPTAGSPFTMTVQSQDAGDNPVNPSSALTLSLASAPTALSLQSGATGLSIPTSANQTTITGIILGKAEGGVTLTVDDGVGGLTAGTSPTLTVANDVPVLAIEPLALTYAGGAGAMPFGGAAIAVSDINSAGFAPFFNGSTITVSIISGGVPTEDLLQVASAGQISVSGTAITYNGLAIGSHSGGAGGNALTVSLTTNNATAAAVDALLHALCFHDLGGTRPTTGTRTIRLAFNDGSLSATPVTRDVDVVDGDALPVIVTNIGLTVARGDTEPITSTNLRATDQEATAVQRVFTVTSFPTHGELVVTTMGVPQVLSSGGVTSFTQDDIDAGRLEYHHFGDSQPGDGFTFILSDGVNVLPAVGFAITVQGAASNPVISLPVSSLSFTENGTAAVIEPGSPYSQSTWISDPDTWDFSGAVLTIEVVNSVGQPDPHPGDQISIRSQTLPALAQYDPYSYFYTPDIDYTGFIATVDEGPGAVRVVHRHYPFYYYWLNDYFTTYYGAVLPPPSTGLPFPSLYSPATYPDSWYAWYYYGIYTPITLDYRIGTIDGTLDGADGKVLKVQMGSGVADLFGTVLVNPSSLARLISNLSFSNTSDDPPTRPRKLRITVTEASMSIPAPAGVALLDLAVTAVNDAPTFVIPSIASPAIDAVAGIPLRARVLAADPDLPTGAALTYALVSVNPPSAGLASVNPVSGAVTFTPLASFASTATLTITAADDQGLKATASLVVNVQSGTTPNGPSVVSDPPFEIFEAETLTNNIVIRPDPTVLAAPVSVSVSVVGDIPQNLILSPGIDQFHRTLSVANIVRPGDGVYTFGIRVAIDYGMGNVQVGYQPVTLKVRAIGAPN